MVVGDKVVVQHSIDLIPPLVGSDVVDIEIFCTAGQNVGEHRVILVFSDLEPSTEVDKDPRLVVEDVVRFARIVPIGSPPFLKGLLPS